MTPWSHGAVGHLNVRLYATFKWKFSACTTFFGQRQCKHNSKARTVSAKFLRERAPGPTTFPSNHRVNREGRVGGVAAWCPAALQFWSQARRAPPHQSVALGVFENNECLVKWRRAISVFRDSHPARAEGHRRVTGYYTSTRWTEMSICFFEKKKTIFF